jgi:uncharacterized protein (TIGR03663 family)
LTTLIEQDSKLHASDGEGTTADQVTNDTPEPVPASRTWLTVEVCLYGLILIVGLALRLWNLGDYPLSEAESSQSLTALRLHRGDPITADSYSPLLASLNGLIFLLFHETEATARLAVALFGGVLILLPATLRRQLGAAECLFASGLLAISPTAVFLSRTVNSEIGVVIGALMLVSGFFNWAEDGQKRWLYLLAGGTAVLLTGGPMAYSILVVFAVIIVLRRKLFLALWKQGLVYADARRTTAEPVGAQPPADDDSDDKAKSGQVAVNPDLKHAGIFLLVALILLSTAATFNLGGFGVTTNLFADWLSRFSTQAQPNAGFNAVFLLAIYEPLIVVAGLIGLAFALVSRQLIRLVFVGWFVGVLVLDLVMAGRPNGSVILVLVPLAFLAAFALAELFHGLQKKGSWSNEGIILVSGVVIAIFGYIGLAGWLDRDCAETDMFCQFAWLQSVAAFMLFVVIIGFFWYALGGSSAAFRGAAVTGIVLALIASVSIGWRLNYGPLMNLGYQPLAGIPASAELIALTNTLSSESSVRAGDRSLLDITLTGPSRPILEWQLRDYSQLTQASTVSNPPTATAIITPTPAAGTEANFSLGEDYVGQDFAIDAVWSPVGMGAKELLNWLIFRELDERPDSSKVVLWLRLTGP